MADDIETMCQHLSLSEKEKNAVKVDFADVEPNIERGERCLILSWLTDRHFNREAFKTTMTRVWQTSQSVSFKALGEKTVCCRIRKFL